MNNVRRRYYLLLSVVALYYSCVSLNCFPCFDGKTLSLKVAVGVIIGVMDWKLLLVSSLGLLTESCCWCHHGVFDWKLLLVSSLGYLTESCCWCHHWGYLTIFWETIWSNNTPQSPPTSPTEQHYEDLLIIADAVDKVGFMAVER